MIPTPLISPDTSRDDWVVRDPINLTILDIEVDIPSGFRTDLASIPRFAWSLVGHPAKPDIVLAAVVHDHLYSTKEVSRFVADIIFLYIMLRAGAEKPFLKFWAVRLFAKKAWRGRQPSDA